MILKSHIPHYPLSEFVDHLFYFEGVTELHNVDRFLPDGNTEIVIDLTDYPKFIYDNETLKEIQTCNQMWVSGIRTGSISIPSGNENKMLVIHFKKGRSHPFYSLPLDELTDCVVDADLIFGNRVSQLREKLLETSDINTRFLIVEEFLFELGGENIEPTLASKCVDYAVGKILETPGTAQIKELTRKIGYSQKHLINLFRKQVGITPKTFMRIIRFQNALMQIEKEGAIDWNQTAFESGYYDQAHFINDFRRFSGFTPGEYVKMKGDLLNYVPVG